MDEKSYTISVFTEHHVGLLHQIAMIFSRRCLNIENLTGSPTAIEGVHKVTITCRGSKYIMTQVVRQIEKRIDVLRAYLHTDEELIVREICLFKISADNAAAGGAEKIAEKHGAKVIESSNEYMVIEQSGTTEEIDRLLEDLNPLGLRQFVRSGRIALTKEELID